MAKINRALRRVLRRDVHFLKLHGLLDYSLLLAVEKNDEKFNARRVFKERLVSLNHMRRASNLPRLQGTTYRTIHGTGDGTMTSRRSSFSSDTSSSTVLERAHDHEGFGLEIEDVDVDKDEISTPFAALHAQDNRDRKQTQREKPNEGLTPAKTKRTDGFRKTSGHALNTAINEPNDGGELSDDGESVDLDVLSYLEEAISEEMLQEMLAGKHRFKDDGKIFHIGIIDYLQGYNTTKKIERCSKVLFYKTTQEAISVAPPVFYGNRFLNFMEKEVFSK